MFSCSGGGAGGEWSVQFPAAGALEKTRFHADRHVNRILTVPGVFADHAAENFADLFQGNLHGGDTEGAVFRIVVECSKIIVASCCESVFLSLGDEIGSVFIVYGDPESVNFC